MKTFAYVSAPDVDTALQSIASEPGAKFLAGGTNLVDLMRKGIEGPETVIDITRLPLAGIEELADGRLRIWALVRNSRLAADPLIRSPVSGSVPGDLAWRLWAASQHGDGRWKPGAAHALSVLLRRSVCVQQARSLVQAARRLRGSTAAMPCSGRATSVSPPTRPTWRWHSRRWTPRRGEECARHTADSADQVPPVARHHATPRNRAGGRRTDHGR
jgi:hypothetical protein